MNTGSKFSQPWPELSFPAFKDTLATVQLWTQIIGKIRLVQMPWINHGWHVTLYVSPAGLTTGSIPYGNSVFQIDFDFQQHKVLIATSAGGSETIDLYPRTVAGFYQELFDKLNTLGLQVSIVAFPNEIEPAIPFEKDEEHKSYDKDQMYTFWKALVNVHNVFTRFRAGFTGKCSPVHFFWGAFDLAVSRFSGREAPKHQGGAPNMPLQVMQESYSHEVCSCGFWPGSEQSPAAAFYSYIYPTPPAFGDQQVLPAEAFYSKEMGEFFLPYDVVRQAPQPEETLLHFLQTTYEAAANTAGWDRAGLECDLTGFEKKKKSPPL